MIRYFRRWRNVGHWLATLSLLMSSTGCRSKPEVTFDKTANFQPYQTQIEYPDLCVQRASAIGEDPVAPHTVREPVPDEMWPLTLDEVMQIALSNSPVMRSVGGRVVSAPGILGTVYDPALQLTNPNTGEEAALSAFDAQLASSLIFDHDKTTRNNARGIGANTFTSDVGAFRTEVSKVAATGTRLSFRNETQRTSTDVNPNFLLFPSNYDTAFTAGFTHPLLQGGGTTFNRIAGPNGGPGSYNGIVLARLRTDIALTDFEQSVAGFMEDIVSTYWYLYYAYRTLDANIAARDSALESWRTAKVQLEEGADDIVNEALAREQYNAFQSAVANSLSGSQTNTTQSLQRGVYTLERSLRLLMGIDINDGRLIRPADEPGKARVVFDWNESVDATMFRNISLRRQHWSVKQREMELLAARNLVLVRLDLVGAYRWRGFGDKLFGEQSREQGSAFRDLWDGNLQGWQTGVQLSTPIGNRIGHVAVRNAELTLSRERAILRELERGQLLALSDATAELDRAFDQTQVNYNRTLAARQRLEGERARLEAGTSVLRFVLQAQSAVADADTQYFRSLVDYNLAVAKIHFVQGTMLDYLGINLSEGPWSEAAYRSAAKESQRYTRRSMNYCLMEPRRVSNGAYPQHVLPRTVDGESSEAVETIATPFEDESNSGPASEVQPADADAERAIPSHADEPTKLPVAPEPALTPTSTKGPAPAGSGSRPRGLVGRSAAA